MSGNYGKLFTQTYTGSLYGAGLHVFAVWGWILANKNENGLIDINPEMLANVLGGSVDAILKAIEYLCNPDPRSRTKEADGARIVKIGEFEYQVVNHFKYQDKGKDRTEYWKEYKRKQRERKKKKSTKSTGGQVDKSGQSKDSTHEDEDGNANAEADENKDVDKNITEVDSNSINSQTLSLLDRTKFIIFLRKTLHQKRIASKSDHTLYKNLDKSLDKEIRDGIFDKTVYDKVRKIAEDSTSGRIPPALFQTKLRYAGIYDTRTDS